MDKDESPEYGLNELARKVREAGPENPVPESDPLQATKMHTRYLIFKVVADNYNGTAEEDLEIAKKVWEWVKTGE